MSVFCLSAPNESAAADAGRCVLSQALCYLVVCCGSRTPVSPRTAELCRWADMYKTLLKPVTMRSKLIFLCLLTGLRYGSSLYAHDAAGR